MSHVKCGGSIFCLTWPELRAHSEKDCGAWEWFIAKYAKSRDPRHDWMQRKLIIVDFHLLRDTGPRPSSTCRWQSSNPSNNCVQQLLNLLATSCSFRSWKFATSCSSAGNGCTHQLDHLQLSIQLFILAPLHLVMKVCKEKTYIS